MSFAVKTATASSVVGLSVMSLSVSLVSQMSDLPTAPILMVGENDSLAGLSHHGAMNGGLIRIVRRQPVLGVCAVNPNERFVEKRLVNIPLRLVPDKGELVTAQVAANHR